MDDEIIEEPVELTPQEKQTVAYVVTILFAAVFFVLGLAGNPLLSSVSVDSLIILYALMLSFAPEISYIPVVAMAAVHAGSIISYYGHPLVLPFVIIERHGRYRSMSIDFIQILVAYEIVRRLASRRGKVSKTRDANQIERGPSP